MHISEAALKLNLIQLDCSEFPSHVIIPNANLLYSRNLAQCFHAIQMNTNHKVTTLDSLNQVKYPPPPIYYTQFSESAINVHVQYVLARE
jgi:hypothetical protein